MLRRLCLVTVLCAAFAGSAPAQVVRFQTTVGEFDMVLNPTDNPVLQDYVDNFVRYVENGNYNTSWINRADTGFVLQMGGFYSHTKRPPPTIASTRPVATFEPVLGQPASENGLSNTSGTVALALPGLPTGGTNQDAGTSSFFINLTSNTFLDADFTVFAAISDMTVVNEIMALMTTDRTQDANFGAGAGNLAFSDVPLEANGQQVFVKRAFMIEDTLSVARARAGIESTIAASAASFDSGNGLASLAAMTVVPEPSTAALVLLSLLGLLHPSMRRR